MLNQPALRLAETLRQMGLQAAYLVNKVNVFYVTAFACHPHERHLGALVTADEHVSLVVPELEGERARAATTATVYTYADTEDPFFAVRRCFDEAGVASGRLGVEKGSMTVRTWEKLFGALPHLVGEDVTDAIAGLRLLKTEDEQERLRRAGQIADQAVAMALSKLRAGMTEADLVAEIDLFLIRNGGLAFDTAVLFGENSALPHGQSGSRALREGDFVLLDLGGIYEGYCSDITRTIVFCEPSFEQRTVFDAVLDAQRAALDAVQAGDPLAQVDTQARALIASRGYGEYFIHRVGHGLGLEAHELPSVHGLNQEPIQVGMVFSIEPGIYIPGLGGVRIEDCVIVTERGPELLTRSPHSICPADYLSD